MNFRIKLKTKAKFLKTNTSITCMGKAHIIYGWSNDMKKQYMRLSKRLALVRIKY